MELLEQYILAVVMAVFMYMVIHYGLRPIVGKNVLYIFFVFFFIGVILHDLLGFSNPR